MKKNGEILLSSKSIISIINLNAIKCANIEYLIFCRLVTDIDDLDSSLSPSKSDASDPDDNEVHIMTLNTTRLPQACTNVIVANISSNGSSVADDDDELGDGLRTGPPSLTVLQQQHQLQQETEPTSLNALIPSQTTHSAQLARTSSLPWIPGGQIERRRRKLPEIPKNKKCKYYHTL